MTGNESSDYRYLLIGGTPKSGTTSVFRYLSHHPEVCPSNRKETYFFAREFDYKGVSKSDKTLDAFNEYFSHCDRTEKWNLSATPYTLYSNRAAQEISALLPNARMIFILREPIARLFSDYKFHLQRNHPHVKGTFAEFVDEQFEMSKTTQIPNLLELGCYSKYLQSFYNFFDKNKISIIFFRELMSNPQDEIQKFCLEIGIDPKFYTNYSFDAHNQTINVRYNFLNQVSMAMEPMITSARAKLMHNPKLYGLFEKAVNSGRSTYYGLNNRRPSDSSKLENVPKEVIKKLEEYYQPYNKKLSRELGKPLPWKRMRTQEQGNA